MPRRRFLRHLGWAGVAGGAAVLGHPIADAAGVHHLTDPSGPTPQMGKTAGHGGLGTVGSVDHARNGFDPHDILTDFDGGVVSTDSTGQVVREYEITAVDKTIEVAPGVFFPAWTYNGRVPGPTLRATEGDRLRITFRNFTSRHHTMHFHGIHTAEMDGVPGQGEVMPGESFVYDFVAEPFGTHLYHCHSLPLRNHMHRGLYGAFVVDPKAGRPPAHEMVMVLNGFDVAGTGANQTYAANTVAFAYSDQPIEIRAGELQRLYVVNVTEFDPINSLHLHANFFQLYRTGTSLTPQEYTDTVSMGMAERHMLEFTYRSPGRYMCHAHQALIMELGWMSAFQVV